MITERTLLFFTFGYYIRSLIEINQFMLVSAVNELYNWNVSDTFRAVSTATAVV